MDGENTKTASALPPVQQESTPALAPIPPPSHSPGSVIKTKRQLSKAAPKKPTSKARSAASKGGPKKEKDSFLRDVDDIEVDGVAKEEKEKDADQKDMARDNRASWCNAIMAKTTKALQKEFVENKKIKPAEYTSDVYEANEAKNRYNDIICIDATRVVLKDRGPEEDYIHASWMVMPDGQKYISTQAPLQETLEDFWHMIFGEKSACIIMLCNLTEGKAEKCARYYPKTTEKHEQFGPFKITLVEVKKPPFEGIKYQVLKVEKDSNSLLVHHMMNHQWLDHTAPLDPAPTVGMLKLSKKLAAGSPITVHCSAGIGRTGTFVGIDYASQKISHNGAIKMIELVKEMRGMRFHCIQSLSQYKFLHICLLELFVQDGAISRTGKYQKYLDNYQAAARRVNEKAMKHFNL